MIPIFIGYDPKEPVAYHVCCDSIIRRASEPVQFIPLALDAMEGFYKEVHSDGSNDFIYSRFLVPCIQDYVGHAIYMDGDMLVNEDIAVLWAKRNYMKAVQVVKHDYQTTQTTKYRGNQNEDYPRKNWSSVMIWNCGHYGNRNLTPDVVSSMTGAELHRFTWLKDNVIGELDPTWNWLAKEYPPFPHGQPALVHYTLGTPCFEGYDDAKWDEAFTDMIYPET